VNRRAGVEIVGVFGAGSVHAVDANRRRRLGQRGIGDYKREQSNQREAGGS
jgi:hypothetical protein